MPHFRSEAFPYSLLKIVNERIIFALNKVAKAEFTLRK